MTIYEYSRLREGEFRLICVLPGTWSDQIAFELFTFPLKPSELPFYEAVSYTWGPYTPRFRASCNGTTIEISQSVDSLLRRFRWSDKIRLLWVDAICIDQENMQERSDQVLRMDEIYRQANRVLIYLGEQLDGSDQVMNLIAERKICDRRQQAKVLAFFHSRKWFHRVWVLQEVALADVALVVCGSKCVPWTCFPAWWARNVAYFDKDHEPPSTFAYDPANFKHASLLQQLHDTRNSKATEPKDKIYALMGLLSPEERSTIRPDYTKGLGEVFTEIAVGIIQRERSLRILSGVKDCGHGKRPDLPSWAPHWAEDNGTASLGLSNKYLAPFDAGGRSSDDITTKAGKHPTPALICSGVKLGRIQEMSCLCSVDAAEEGLVNILNQWYHLASQLRSEYNPSRHSFIAFAQGRFHLSPAVEAPDFLATILAEPSPTLEANREQHETGISDGWPPERFKFCLGRRLFMTNTGFIGLGPAEAQIGDLLAVLLAAPVPMVLREDEGSAYNLVGECYSYGVMGGESTAHLNIPGHRIRPYSGNRFSEPLENFVLR